MTALAARAERVIFLPYFLSAGVHVQRDLTAMCARLGAAHPGVEFILAEPLGRHPLLLEAVADRAREAVRNQESGVKGQESEKK